MNESAISAIQLRFFARRIAPYSRSARQPAMRANVRPCLKLRCGRATVLSALRVNRTRGNFKATNGRANGEYRKRDIADMGAQGIASLALFLRRLKKASHAAGGWAKLHGRLASRLARVCKAVGIDRVSLYTLRHVGIASAKTWMEPHEVAAAAGHGSVHTATSHYAKRRTGWRGLRLAGKPLPESISDVRGTARYFQPQRPRQDTASLRM